MSEIGKKKQKNNTDAKNKRRTNKGKGKRERTHRKAAQTVTRVQALWSSWNSRNVTFGFLDEVN